jgi:hypothetical protein
MIRLRDAERGTTLGSITEEQLQFLVDALEETSSTDQDYYVDAATIDMLEEEGAEPALVQLLRSAIAGRDGMEVRWSQE